MSGKKAIHVGDFVRFQFGTIRVTGTVTEDRGPIGLKGRRLYRIFCSPEPEFSFYTELPAVDLEPVKEMAPPESIP